MCGLWWAENYCCCIERTRGVLRVEYEWCGGVPQQLHVKTVFSNQINRVIEVFWVTERTRNCQCGSYTRNQIFRTELTILVRSYL